MRREFRYMVIKVADAHKYLTPSEGLALDLILDRIQSRRADDGKPSLECVVVESDWPEYEPTWKAIAERVDNEGATA